MVKHIEQLVHNVTISVYVDERYERQSDVVFNTLGSFNSEDIVDGVSMQIGWSLYYLDEVEHDHYVVMTLDYMSDIAGPKVKDLTVPLGVQANQLLMLSSTNTLDKVDDTVSFNDTIILAKGVLNSKHVYLERTSEVESGDSGWYVGYVDEDVDDLEFYAVRTHELLALRPELLRVLMLPFDYVVVFKDWDIVAILNADDELVLEL